MSGVRVLWRRSREEIIRLTRRFAEKAVEKHPSIKRVCIAGSVARNTHSPRSDVDIVIVYSGEKPSYACLKKIASETIGLPVDIVLVDHKSLGEISEKTKKEWLENSVQIYP